MQPTRALGTAAAVMALGLLTACGLTGPKNASGTITELRHEEQWIELDCTVSAGEPTCTAAPEDDCYLVVFEGNGYEYSDCTTKRAYDRLKVGEEYTDVEDSD